MISLREQYKVQRRQRKHKSKIKRQVLLTLTTAITLIALIIYVAPPITSSSSSSSSIATYSSSSGNDIASSPFSSASSSSIHRQLLQDDEEEDHPEGYPPDALNEKQREQGGWILYFLGMMYTFIAIALVCDEWFVPAIEEIVERMDMTPAAAGATWMAAGGSAPELFTSLIGTFISRSNVGFGTIVGSAVFNVLFVIGCCAIFTPGHLPLTWWPFARDCIYYICSLIVLAIFYGVNTPDVIDWWEAMLLLLLYLGYCTIMFNNTKLRAWAFRKMKKTDAAAEARKVSNEDKLAVEMEEKTDGHEKEQNGQTGTKFSEEAAGGGDGEFDEEEEPLPATGIHFHASLYKFFTKDSTVKDLMGLHIVARIKGETKETFESIDADGNGHIDRDELKKVLFNLGEQVNEEDVTECFKLIDADGNGEISFKEFETWYLSSKLRITTDVKKIFHQFDDNGDGHIDCDELRVLLETMNDGEKEITDEDVERAMKELGKHDVQKDKISEQEFIDWYSGTAYFEQKQMKRQATVTTVEEEEAEGIDLSFPEGTFQRIMYVVTAPIMFTLYYTLPDVQKEARKYLWPLTFAGSMLWLGFYSYLMVWWAVRVGAAWHVPDEVMGLTFLAAGTSVPDLISSVIVAKMGEGDMAVSSSIGSNIFDILIGLPFPWLVFCLTIGWDNGKKIDVYSNSLFLSVVILILMLFLVLIVIRCNNW
eukprot:CAMPEP_0197021402 /NCGR_PEP_ID=MMETSP1384-20130603/2264_1 /TAXON_ID=29189 /ORGANISM="Ammonia sp." /LENGTH=705 /DNA_ID=CAMNT_0042449215 /DNA_START=122 /DNA_END=2236 /DNA_ORIENTATION=-